MADKLTDLSCNDFTAAIAAKQPVPGGGGAAALVGAMAAALCSMTGNYTTGKKTYAAVEDDVQRMLAEAEDVRVRLIELVDADAKAFEPLSHAYAIPKDDPNRAEVLEAATKTACEPPIEMMRQCARAVELLEEMEQKGSRMMLSDVGCGATLAASALEAASLNVFVNTKSLADRAYADALDAEAQELLDTYVPRAHAVWARVSDRLRG